MKNLITKKRLNTILLVFSYLIVSSCSQKQNWPQFRGSESNMISQATTLPSEWGDGKNIEWKYKIEGKGFSSPIVWDNKVFFVSAVPVKVTDVPAPQSPQPASQGQDGAQGAPQAPPPPPAPAQDSSYLEETYRWEVTCVDLNTGTEIWKKVAFEGSPKGSKHTQSNYSTESPVTDGERIYAYFGAVGLFCYDLEGNLLWKNDLSTYETQNGWGTGSSPVVFENILYIQNDNEVSSYLIALDAATGAEKWKVARTEKTTYATPFIWKNKIRKELVLMGKTVYSYDLKTGAVLWNFIIGGDNSIPSPVADQNLIYLGNAGGMDIKSNFYAVKAGAEGDISLPEGASSGTWVEWTVVDARMGNPSPLLYNGLLYYIASAGGRFTCLNATTGAQVYSERVSGVGTVWASPWAYGDKICFYDEKGVTHIIKAGEQFELLNENKLTDSFWTSVAITGDAYIIKGAEWLYCIKDK